MSELYAGFHPDTVALGEMMRAAQGQAMTGSGPRRAALLRVSDESRTRFMNNLDDNLDWLLWSEQVSAVKDAASDVELFRPGPAGGRARTRAGMYPLYARGTQRLIGGWLPQEDWLFVFLLTSAAKADLPRGDNAACEAIKATLLALATDDPHDTDGRSVLYAHALDRIFRAETYAWQTHSALTQTYVRVDAAGRMFDALTPNAKDEWTLITFGASRARDDTARRFLISRLNTARAGNWPGNAAGLPVGFAPSNDLDGQGRPVIDPEGSGRDVKRPVPDPGQRQQVATIADVFADPAITTWSAAAVACGRRGITSRGVDEKGVNLAELSDKASAGRLLCTPKKIRAYLTGRLAHTEKGVTPGQFRPGDGHVLEPRYAGDDLGAVTYDVVVGRPEDHGWAWGVEVATWAHVLRKFWLPGDFEPDGWAWDNDPADWDWQQLFTASRRPHRRAVTGRHAACADRRPFSGLMRWETDSERHLLSARGAGCEERYQWRAEPWGHARRQPRTNKAYSMRDTDGVVQSSWPVSEFHQHWAALVQATVEAMVATDAHVDPEQRLTPKPDHDQARRGAEARHEHASRLEHLRQTIAENTKDAAALRRSAAHHRDRGNDALADEYDTDAIAATNAARDTEELWSRLAAEPDPTDAPPSPEQADFGTAAAVIAALTGPYAAGPAPVALQSAIRELGAETTRLEVVDGTTVRLSVTVRLRTSSGRIVTRTGSALIRRSRAAATRKDVAARRQEAKRALARAWFYEGATLDELAARAGASQNHALRLAREYLATGTARTPGQQPISELAAARMPSLPLRRTIAQHPIAAARTAVWCALNPRDPLPGAIDPVWAELTAAVFLSGNTWARASRMWKINSDHRLDVVTMLRALPDPASRLAPEQVGALLGIDPATVTLIGRDLQRGQVTIPAPLERTRRPGARRGASPFSVGLHRCPWPDCESPAAGYIVNLPELTIGCDTSVLCRRCLRPPTRNLRFPEPYRQFIDATNTRHGTWIRCAAQCDHDHGAGAGLVWRWNDDDPTRHNTHPECGDAREPDRQQLRDWARANGHTVADHGRIPQRIIRSYDRQRAGH